MTVSMTTQEDFLRLLDEDAGFRQQVRQHILGQELLELPERFAVFVGRVDEFITEQRTINAEQRAVNTEQRIVNARLEKQMQTLLDDVGFIKGDAAIRAARANAETIAEQVLGLQPGPILQRAEMFAVLRPLAPRLQPQVRQSFYRADLVMACRAEDGTLHYMAVEAFYTGDRRDSDRALRNADFLTRCTNAPAHAVVASVRNDHEVQALVDAGRIHWYRLTARDLQPD